MINLKKILILCLSVLLIMSLCDVKLIAIESVDDEFLPKISTTRFNSFSITSNGNLYEWGRRYDDLDETKTGYNTLPVFVLSDVIKFENTRYEDNPRNNATPRFALKKDGTLWGWGMNATYGQLATGDYVNSDDPIYIINNVLDISVGKSYNFAIRNDNSLWGWGYNGYKQLGDVAIDQHGSVKTPVKILDDVKTAVAGNTYSLAIKTDNSLWGWGTSEGGGLANFQHTQKYPVNIMNDVAMVKIGINTTSENTFAIKTDGTLWAWGNNAFSQIGNGGTDTVYTPELILDNVKDVIPTMYSTFAIKHDNSLWGWGYNIYGALGDGTTQNSTTPKMIATDVKKVSSVAFVTHVLKNDGTLWAAGWNDSGLLGDGTTTSSSIFVQIMSNVCDVETSYDHVLALGCDGTVFSWEIINLVNWVIVQPKEESSPL
jgi:alpha-tubulin suppressor-like RCC1 family protein